MTLPPARPVTVPAFLRARHEQIVRVWEGLVLAEERRVELSGLALRNSIPGFLDELATWLESEAPPGGSRLAAQSLHHVIARLDSGFDLAQVLREHRLLREAILRVVLEAELEEQEVVRSAGAREARVVELARLNAGIDVALEDAIASFVAERDRRDALERERSIELLRESDRRKSDFLSVLSHELRNPLAAIRNGVFVLERTPAGSEPASQAVAIIARQAGVLLRLVDDLLDLTRISSGKVRLERERLDLRDVARRTSEDLRSILDAAGVALHLELPPAPVWVDGDPVRLGQILGNLLHNAAKFTPAGGRATVTVAAGDAGAELRVRDTGIGMEPGAIERFFEPFTQGDGSLARAQSGLGLGLALVRGLVELHGGEVHARSDGPGRGAELVVTLPLAQSAGRPPARSDATPGAGRRVLVIEDNPDAGDSLADLLRLLGHTVHVARDGRSGIAAARELRPDVILCDLGMPGVDGFAVARTLRAEPALRALRLVALSGYAQPADVERAKEAGFDAHLAKPPDPDAIARVLG